MLLFFFFFPLVHRNASYKNMKRTTSPCASTQRLLFHIDLTCLFHPRSRRTRPQHTVSAAADSQPDMPQGKWWGVCEPSGGYFALVETSSSVENLTPALYKMSYRASILKEKMFSYGTCFLRKWDLNWIREKDDSHLVLDFRLRFYRSLLFKNYCMAFGIQLRHTIKWHKRINKGHSILKDITWKDTYNLYTTIDTPHFCQKQLYTSAWGQQFCARWEVLNADFNICHPP